MRRTDYAAGEAAAVVDRDAAAIGDLYRKHKKSLRDSVRYAVECGRRLLAKKDSMKHGEWLPWLKTNADVLGFESRRTATRLMREATKWDVNVPFEAISEDAAAAINRVLWGNNLPMRGNGFNEWCTPSDLIANARRVLGTIDLDPASHRYAQKIVRAKRFFTREQDGLSRPWFGKVWCNPPYDRFSIGPFVDKLIGEIKAGRVSEAIMLTHNHTDALWFRRLADNADVVCFTSGRVKFYDSDEIATPVQGQALSYFGPHVHRFTDGFESVGWFSFRRVA
jgi:DNA N-6-adenine-methyltransferase (Dam)/Protein of unknown function (DUF3102)